jgi:TonB-dependent receptor
MRVILAFVWLATAVLGVAADLGGIRGSVYDKEFGGPLGKVQVTVVEAMRVTQTTSEGLFSIEGVAPGKYTVLFGKDGYLRQAAEVTVPAGGFADVRVELAGEVTEMEEFVVRGLELGGSTELGLLGIRQEAIGMQDAISAELFSKAGASTAAGALKLVVGTSVQDDKYAVIRGLSDRYVGTLLNNMCVPSPDPEKRAVQMDMFPAGTIENITVYKTFTPDLQGDFSGGGIAIKTKSIPDKLTMSVSAGLEYNTQTSANDNFLSYRGGGTGFSGMAGDSRQLPSGVSKTLVPLYLGPSRTPTPAQWDNARLLDQQTRSLAPAMGVQKVGAPGPNYSFQAMIGDRLRLNDNNILGLYAALTYRHKFSHAEGTSRRYSISGAQQEPNTTSDFDDTRSTEEVLWGAVSGVEWRFAEKQALGIRLLYNQSAKDEARHQVDPEYGGTPDSPIYDISQSLHYTERRLAMAQVYGEHKFEPEWAPQIDWYGALGLASQDEPDVRFFRNLYDTATSVSSFIGQTWAERTLRVWRNIEEVDKQAALNIKFPFRQWTGTEGFIKLGGFYDQVNRDYDEQSFWYEWPSQLRGSTAAQRAAYTYNTTYVRQYQGSNLWTDVFTDPGRVGLATNSTAAPNQLLYIIQTSGSDVDYTGQQTVKAGYLMTELPLTPRIKLIGGARLEQTEMNIAIATLDGKPELLERRPTGAYGFVTYPSDAAGGKQLTQTDLLPAVGLVWEIIPRLYLKGNWSQTLARPTFRELAPVATLEFLGDDAFVGNPQLKISNVDNYDVRLEWFRRAGDVVAASAFYKQIKSPIERVNLQISGSRYITPVNYDQGDILGFEIEARQRMDVLHECLRPLTLGANASYIKSEVEIPREERQTLANYGLDTRTRAMAGQPDYLANAFMTLEFERTGTTIGLFYTLTGRSLVAGAGSGGGDAVPSLYEEPFETLNFSLDQRIGRHWSVRFQVKNILDPPVKRVYELPWATEGMIHTEYHRGVDFSLSASCSW